MHDISDGISVPFCSVRLSDFYTCGFREEMGDEWLALFRQFPGVCDGVWFATSYGFPLLAIHARCADKMVEMASSLRASGIACSLQVSNSIGHSNSMHLDNGGITWDGPMVGLNGVVAAHCHCPIHPGFQEYIAVSMREYARCFPDYVWIDDDLRMIGHAPVRFGCFCERCMKRFSRQMEKTFTQGRMAELLDVPKNGWLRSAWMAFNQERMAELAQVIVDATLEVSPQSRFGLQQASAEGGFYNGKNSNRIYAVLSANEKRITGCRGGGGHYTDFQPRGIIEKAWDISRQIAKLPDGVAIRVPEIENFTHSAIGKTPRGTALEAAVFVAVGCNALSIANLMYVNETVAWHAGTFRTLEAWKPYMAEIIAHCGTSFHAGMSVYFPEMHDERELLEGEPAAAWTNASMAPAYSLANVGLALCTDVRAARGALLAPEAAKGITESELIKLINEGLLMDGSAAFILQKRGFSTIIGASIRPLTSYNSPEHFTDDPLNGDNPTPAMRFNPFDRAAIGFAIEPMVNNYRTLGTFRAADGSDAGISTVAIDTGSGRIGIIGRNAWCDNISTRRRDQILNLADWVCRHRSMAMVITTCQIVPIVRATVGGELRAVTLLNQGFDESPALSLLLRTSNNQKGEFAMMAAEGERIPLAQSSVHEDQKNGSDGCRAWLLSLPKMERWSVATIFCE